MPAQDDQREFEFLPKHESPGPNDPSPDDIQKACELIRAERRTKPELEEPAGPDPLTAAPRHR